MENWIAYRPDRNTSRKPLKRQDSAAKFVKIVQKAASDIIQKALFRPGDDEHFTADSDNRELGDFMRAFRTAAKEFGQTCGQG
jgi:hypothetical protein